VPAGDWPEQPEVVERMEVRSCVRRGAAIDLVLARPREKRSQLVYTIARGREAVFWQSPRTRKQARPNVRTPTARAAALAELQIVVDSHEQYAYRFAGRSVTTVRQALPAGDYAVTASGRLVAAVERKSLPDLVTSLTTGKLKYALGELAALPRAAVVVEDRYSQLFKLDHVRPAVVTDGLAELQVGWPTVPLVFCETRPLAEEWTYRYLAAAATWAATEPDALARIRDIPVLTGAPRAPGPPGPPTARVRAWARTVGIDVPDRGRLPPQVWARWHDAHPEPL
jgi:ERCC4 domain